MDDGTDNEPHEETNLQTDDDSDGFGFAWLDVG